MIEFTDISYAIKNKNVLKNISLTCQDGVITGIAGTSGSGKTSLLTLPLKSTGEVTGSIKINKKEIMNLKSRDREELLAILYRSYNVGINMETSVFNFVLSGRSRFRKKLSPHSRADKDLTENLIHNFKLDELKGEKLRNLSDSMLQLVLMANIINRDTLAVFLCSPEVNLHPDQYSLLKLILKQFLSENLRSILIESNNLNFLLSFCDKILFLKNGEAHGEYEPGEVDSTLIKEIFSVDVSISKNLITSRPELQILANI